MKLALIPNDFSMDLERIFKLCEEEHVNHVELAYMWGKSILDLSEEELKKVKSLMETYNLKAASIQTQIGKVFPPGALLAKEGSGSMHRDYNFNVSRMDRAIEIADLFQTEYIVMYSFFTYLDWKTEVRWNLLLESYEKFLNKLEKCNKTAVIECEGDTLIRDIDSYMQLFKHFKSPDKLRANLDLANLLSTQDSLSRTDFETILPYLKYLHVKDKTRRKILWNKPQVFGNGDIPWVKTFKWLKDANWNGTISVEPHVHGKNKFELGRQCVRNLKSLLHDLGIKIEH